ncbi:MAG: hypothetical protein ACO1NW_08230 [Chitinophagaceae bacterium]
MKYFLLICIALFPMIVSAQTGTKKTNAPTQKTVFSTTIGNFRSATAPASLLKALIDSALRVSDNKGVKYEVESFEFTYRQKDEFTNDETGKKEVLFRTVQHKAEGALLPELWRNTIRERLKKDETLWFEKIIIKNKEGKRFLAPSLEIKVQ